MAPNVNHTPFNGRGTGADRKVASPASEMSERGSTTLYSLNSTLMSPFTGYPESTDSSFLLSPTDYYKSFHGSTAQPSARVAGLSDPFTTSEARPSTGLNATASSFQPGIANRRENNPGASQNFGMSYLTEVIANNEQPPTKQLSRSGTFTRDASQSRVIKVVCKTEGFAVDAVQNYLHLMNRRLHGTQTMEPISEKVLYLRYSHITDAIAVYDVLSTAPELGQVSYFDVKGLANIFPHYSGRITQFEGQMVLTVNYPIAARTGIAKHVFESKVREAVEIQGTLHAYECLLTTSGDELHMVVEFDNMERVPAAVQRLNGMRIDGSVLYVKSYHPDVSHDPYFYMSSSSAASDFAGPDVSSFMSSAVTSYNPPGQVIYGGQPLPLTYGNHPMPYNASTAIVPYGQQLYMVTPMPSYGMQPYAGGYHHHGGYNGRGRGGWQHRPGRLARRHNHYDEENSFKKSENMVKIERIEAGLDVRTTVMLRNIPNKMTQPELKKIIDQICRGKYDFLYLRIDFSNNCNVGYAFINFLDPLDIVPFIRARANRRWDYFRSDKVAEVSYATIQGRDCLIQKFRNSSVMLEGEECRPKLFYTEGHPMCGQEEPFPCADNQSKLKRSCENAEHVGLFAPAVGQHFRYEQRYRNSQYDRGTSMAIRERDFDDNFAGGYIEFPPHNGNPGFADLFGDGGEPSHQFESSRGRGGFRGGSHRGNFRGNYGYQGSSGPSYSY